MQAVAGEELFRGIRGVIFLDVGAGVGRASFVRVWLVGALQTFAGMSGDMPANVCRPSGRAPTLGLLQFRGF